mgnify:CR=1 FL=1
MTRHKSIPVPVPEPVPEPEPVKKQKITAVAVELPEWIDAEIWEGFMEVRRSKRRLIRLAADRARFSVI